MERRGGAKKKATVSTQFKVCGHGQIGVVQIRPINAFSSHLTQTSLHSLMTTLGQANPFFVRCLKPNVEKVKDKFLPQIVLNQLKYSGMMETVRIRRLGYPVRRTYDDFLFRYNVLGRSLQLDGKEPKPSCAAIMQVHDNTKKNWQVGKTKVRGGVLSGLPWLLVYDNRVQVFYRENLERILEKERDNALRDVCRIIFYFILAVVTRRRYLRKKAMIVQVQKYIRVCLGINPPVCIYECMQMSCDFFLLNKELNSEKLMW